MRRVAAWASDGGFKKLLLHQDYTARGHDAAQNFRQFGALGNGLGEAFILKAWRPAAFRLFERSTSRKLRSFTAARCE